MLQLAKAHGVKMQKVKEGRYIVEGKITIFVRVSKTATMLGCLAFPDKIILL